MPGIVAAYDEMKANGVELVLIGCDETVEAAQKFLESFQAAFPGVHYKDERINTLPGYLPAKGVPDAIFVDRQGRVLRRGHGYLVQFWRQVLGFEPQSDASAAAPKAP